MSLCVRCLGCVSEERGAGGLGEYMGTLTKGLFGRHHDLSFETYLKECDNTDKLTEVGRTKSVMMMMMVVVMVVMVMVSSRWPPGGKVSQLRRPGSKASVSSSASLRPGETLLVRLQIGEQKAKRMEAWCGSEEEGCHPKSK